MNLNEYRRRPSREVRIGSTVIGGDRPIAVQSMTNTPTADTEASVAQIERITGFKFLTNLPAKTAEKVKKEANLDDWYE